MSIQRSAAQFDDIFGYIGECGKYQIWHYFLVCLSVIIFSMHMYLNTFTFATPPHRCRLWEEDVFDINPNATSNSTSNSTTALYWIETLIPNGGKDSCHVKNYSGVYPNFTYDPNSTSVIKCSDWVFDESNFQNNVVTNLQLFCDKNDWVTFADSMVFVGALIGSFIIGDISDRFGRHRALMFSIIGLLGAGCGTAYMKTYWGIVGFRTASSAFAIGIFMSTFVLGVEMMGPSMRSHAGIVIEFFFAGGSMLLACLAYYIRDWVWLQLAVSIPLSLFVLFFFIIDESPRWLLIKGKMKQFEKGIQKMSSWNGKSVPAVVVSELEDAAFEMKAQKQNSGSFVDVFRFPNVALKSINIFLGWIVNTMLYYGITMNMTALPGSPFLLVVISGGVELPAYVLCLFLINRLGRRVLVSGPMMMAGIACFLCPFFTNQPTVVTSLAIAGKFFTSIAFAVIFIFTAEIFPTCIRTIGIGLSSFSARIGGILFPIIIQFFESKDKPEVALFIFGIMSLASGVFLAFLPETLNKVLPETLEQADEFGRPKCCGVAAKGRGLGRNEGAPLLAGGVAGTLLRPSEGHSLLEEEEEEDELFSTNALT